MERFVQLLAAGGIVLVGGLWLVALAGWGSPLWIGGVVLAILGACGLTAGIIRELEVDMVAQQ